MFVSFLLQTQVPLFDYYTTFKELTFEDNFSKINFCDANDREINTFYTDLDGSLHPYLEKVRTDPATIMGNVPALTQFVDQRRCVEDKEGCSLYCVNTCFRGVLYMVDPSGTEDWKLRVCEEDNPNSCVYFPGHVRAGQTNQSAQRDRMFFAYLPKGRYTSVFVNPDGKEDWPSYVQTRFQDDQVCPSALEEEDVRLIEPEVQLESCDQLIRNQDFEESQHDPAPWLQRHGGIHVSYGDGTSTSISPNALTSDGPDASNMIMQFIDSRCLVAMQGEFYEITALVKLVDAKGNPYICQPEIEECPEIGFGEPRLDYMGVTRERRITYGTVKPGPTTNGFQLLQGVLQLTPDMIHPDFPSRVFIRSNQRKNWYIDNVSVRRIIGGTPIATGSEGQDDEYDPEEEEETSDYLGVGALVSTWGHYP